MYDVKTNPAFLVLALDIINPARHATSLLLLLLMPHVYLVDCAKLSSGNKSCYQATAAPLNDGKQA
jgi:hypothetical protein